MTTTITAHTTPPPADWPTAKRPLAGRPVLPIVDATDGQSALRLDWPGPTIEPDEIGNARLRIAIAVDHREPHRVAATVAGTGEPLGTIDAWFSSAGQVFEWSLTRAQAVSALSRGVTLSLAEPMSPLWIVADGDAVPEAIRPHMLLHPGQTSTQSDATIQTMLDLLSSLASLQPCDWMEACVLDGLTDWAKLGRTDAERALDGHLDVFFPASGDYVHESIRGEPIDNRPAGQENHGPIAALARRRPDHPAVGITVDAMLHRWRDDVGGVVEGQVAAETCYSVAHVMACIWRYAGADGLDERAVSHLRLTQRCLAEPDCLWLRYRPDSGKRTFMSWSRGVAWYTLGFARTLVELPAERRPGDLIDELQRVLRWTLSHQRQDGLWPCFFDEPDTVPDTSGSAGLAAAIAIAARHGLVDAACTPSAARTLDALTQRLTPDGWLTGASPSNKREAAAIDVQRSAFRIIGPWGMGLMAQLAAALHATGESA